MRRLLLLGGLVLTVLAFASQASASTTVSVSMTFTEPIIPGLVKGCPVADGFCGNGQVIPLGQANETIAFGAGCGDGSCDLRTINLAGGSIILNEVFSDPTCPGSCHPNRAEPGGGTLTDTVVGGTGIFAAAKGSLSGSVWAAGPHSQIKLAGTISY
jgi:hypothetical protein